MPFRRLPDSDNTRTNALQVAKEKADTTDPVNWAIDAATKTRIDTTLPAWKQEVSERGEALSGQLKPARKKTQAGIPNHYCQNFAQGTRNLLLLRFRWLSGEANS